MDGEPRIDKADLGPTFEDFEGPALPEQQVAHAERRLDSDAAPAHGGPDRLSDPGEGPYAAVGVQAGHLGGHEPVEQDAAVARLVRAPRKQKAVGGRRRGRTRKKKRARRWTRRNPKPTLDVEPLVGRESRWVQWFKSKHDWNAP